MTFRLVNTNNYQGTRTDDMVTEQTLSNTSVLKGMRSLGVHQQSFTNCGIAASMVTGLHLSRKANLVSRYLCSIILLKCFKF